MVAERIRLARTDKGLSQSDLGRLLSRPRTHAAISDLERGRTKVDVELLIELANLLDRPVLFFLPLTLVNYRLRHYYDAQSAGV